MIFKALVCDYDGTLATQDRLVPEVVEALHRASRSGLRLVLVTGRTFFELNRVCEPLDLFDVVVAENGGVLYFPRSGTLRDQGPPPSPRLLAELDRRGLYYQAGRVIVGTARADEAAVGEAMAAAGVTLELIPNRAALMLLPAGISKGTGVGHAIRALGLSFQDVLAVGDAENDLALFEACGWAACPANAVAEVFERADWVFPGESGEAVAAAITGLVLPGRLALSESPRHRFRLGWAAATGEVVSLAERGINVLIQGDPLSGKSWLAGAMVERLVARRYAICVLDPEGDYQVLRQLRRVTWSGVGDAKALEQALAGLERDPSTSAVLDLSAVDQPGKTALVQAALERIAGLRQRVGVPHWVVLDEAHYFLNGNSAPASEVGALEDRGFCLVTYRSGLLAEPAVRAMDVFVLAPSTDVEELAFLRQVLDRRAGLGEPVAGAAQALPRGQFIVVQPGAGGAWRAQTVTPTPRQTFHVRHLRKYADSAVPADRAFVFRRPDGREAARAASLRQFREALGRVEPAVIAHHGGRGDFSRWIEDVFSDTDLAHQVRKSEGRWRAGSIRDLRSPLEAAILLRYGR
jgi:hypothetical protein